MEFRNKNIGKPEAKSVSVILITYTDVVFKFSNPIIFNLHKSSMKAQYLLVSRTE